MEDTTDWSKEYKYPGPSPVMTDRSKEFKEWKEQNKGKDFSGGKDYITLDNRPRDFSYHEFLKTQFPKCYSCGRTFTPNKHGACSTRLARDKGVERQFCSEDCKDWHCDYRLSKKGDIVRNPSYNEQLAIEKRLMDAPLDTLKAADGSNPYQSIIDGTKRAEEREATKHLVSNPCLWCGYSMDGEPEADGKFCSPSHRDWYYSVEKRQKQLAKENKKTEKENKRPMNNTQKLKHLAEHLNISPRRIKNGRQGYTIPVIEGRKGNIYFDGYGNRWVVSVKNISKRLSSSLERKLSFMRPHTFQEQARDILNPDSKRAYNVGFSLDRMPSESEAEIIRKVLGLKVSVKTDPTSQENNGADIVLAA